MKHTNQVILGLICVAIILLIVPIKVIIMGIIVYIFTKNFPLRQSRSSERSSRRLKEWWDSVPTIPVHLVEWKRCICSKLVAFSLYILFYTYIYSAFIWKIGFYSNSKRIKIKSLNLNEDINHSRKVGLEAYFYLQLQFKGVTPTNCTFSLVINRFE